MIGPLQSWPYPRQMEELEFAETTRSPLIQFNLQVDQYPVPRVEDLFATLAGGQKFSKLDLSHAYQQVLLEPASRKYMTLNTHKGLSGSLSELPAPQPCSSRLWRRFSREFPEWSSTLTIDILVTGQSDEEHMQVIEQVLERLQSFGLRLKRDKCSFLKPSVEYLGYLVDKEGLHATPAKVEAITKAPEPRNVH